MKDGDNDILFTIKGIEIKFYREVYGMRLHLLTRFSRVFLEKQRLRPIVQSETSGQMVIIHCFLNNFVIIVDFEPWSRLPCWRHQMTSEWRVFEGVDA